MPFPVHAVERVETRDWVSRSRFVTRYAYHHGYFDGIEREFRGFGLVESLDTEEFAALSESDAMPDATLARAACAHPHLVPHRREAQDIALLKWTGQCARHPVVAFRAAPDEQRRRPSG